MALFITIIGLCFITGAFSQEVILSGKAILLGLGAGFGYALYSIFSKMIIDKYEAVTIITLYYRVKKLEAGKASILATIEPIVSAIVGLIFFQEVFDLTKILGMICIISAIIILNLNLVKAKSVN